MHLNTYLHVMNDTITKRMELFSYYLDKAKLDKKKYQDVFTTKELTLCYENNLLSNKNSHDDIIIIEPLLTIKNWKKIIESNKYLEKKIPTKYLIKLKKIV